MKNKIAIVTGGAGFIGSHMVDLLISKKYKVHVIDNLSGGHKKNLSHHKKNSLLKFEKIDIRNLKKNHSFFKNADFVFHFAGIGDIVPSIENPVNYMETNIQGTIRVLEASRYNNIKKFVYSASAACYGLNTSRTKESAKIDPKYPYALSKYMGEQAAFHWHKVYNLPVNSIRIFNAYGTRVRTTGAYGAVFGVFFKQKIKNKPFTIVGNGKQSRDFVYVTDVAKAFFHFHSSLTKPLVDGKTIILESLGVSIEFERASNICVEEYQLSAGFNKTNMAYKLVVVFDRTLKTKILL